MGQSGGCYYTSMPDEIEKYGLRFKKDVHPLKIELLLIKHFGYYEKDGVQHGEGLSFHLERAKEFMWPHLDAHRWHNLCRDNMATHQVCALLGPGSSGKTNAGAWIALAQWLANPEETMVMCSSTDMRGLRLRVWGEITSLWEMACAKFPFLPGHMLDSKLAITFDSSSMDDGDYDSRAVRNFRSAIIGIPTVQGGKNVGLGRWIGAKQKNVILVADECQFMGSSFLSAFANLNKNQRFVAYVLGNPVELLDPLGKASEPLDGWDLHMEPEVTEVWKTRFMNGVAVNLVGTDSPNNDYPDDKPRYKYLISKKKIEETAQFFGRDTYEFYSQCKGTMRVAQMARRVITRKLCEQNGALEQHVIWLDGTRTRLASLDSAWGGDRAVFYHGEFGKNVEGKLMLQIQPPETVPLVVRSEKEPEQQIAEWIKTRCEHLGIPPENFAHDSTGRGSLGTYLARVWSAKTNPIEFGGAPTDRPVSADVFIKDPKTGENRLMTCRERYIKAVSEYWYSTHYLIAAGQLRGLTEDVMEEGISRKYEIRSGDRIEVETKLDMKERLGRSPDLYDSFVILVEMARRRGFTISKLANDSDSPTSTDSWITTRSEALQRLHKAQQLNYAA